MCTLPKVVRFSHCLVPALSFLTTKLIFCEYSQTKNYCRKFPACIATPLSGFIGCLGVVSEKIEKSSPQCCGFCFKK